MRNCIRVTGLNLTSELPGVAVEAMGPVLVAAVVKQHVVLGFRQPSFEAIPGVVFFHVVKSSSEEFLLKPTRDFVLFYLFNNILKKMEGLKGSQNVRTPVNPIRANHDNSQ